MDKLTDGQAKDLILEYCVKYNKKSHSPNDLNRKVLPDTPTTLINDFIVEIGQHSRTIADVRITDRRTLIYAINTTAGFLADGGFTQIEAEDNARIDKENERQNMQDRIRKLEEKSLKFETSGKKKMYRTSFIISIIISLITTIITILTYVKGHK